MEEYTKIINEKVISIDLGYNYEEIIYIQCEKTLVSMGRLAVDDMQSFCNKVIGKKIKSIKCFYYKNNKYTTINSMVFPVDDDWFFECYENKKLNIFRDAASRIIQNQAKIWLYSSPNGPMFLKEIKRLQEDGFLLT
jgi:hypothetical protein